MDKTTPLTDENRTDRQQLPRGRRTRRDGRSRWHERTDRGQSELLGGILMFGLAISLLVLIQVAAVPTWNQQLEFEHSQRAAEDLQQLGQVLSDVAADGGDRTVVVSAGVRYPQRPFLFNPPPANGQLSTTDQENVVIENGQIDGVDNYWNETETFETRAIRYDASYNEYQNDPVSTYEYGLLVEEFPNGFTRETTTFPVINGTNVNLVLVDGRLSETTPGTVSVPVEGTSAPSEGVKLESRNGDPVVVTLPTAYPALWEERLEDEANVESVTATATGVEIALNGSKTYNLRMAEVTVGSGNADEGAAYVTTKGDPTRVVARNTSNELTVEVRDRFNNPVSGVEVEFAITGGSGASGATLADTTATSGEDGEASVFIETLDDGPVTVEATINGGDLARERTEFTVDAVEGGIRATGGDGNGGPEDAVSSINPETIELTETELLGGNNVRDIRLRLRNNLDADHNVTQVRISFYFDSQNNPPESVEYNVGGTTNIPIGLAFVDVGGPTIEDGQSRDLFMTINGNNNGYSSDFFILSIKYQEASGGIVTYSYVVSFQ